VKKATLLIAGLAASLLYSPTANSHPIPTKDVFGCPTGLNGITFDLFSGCIHEPHIQHYPATIGESLVFGCDAFYGNTCYKGKGIVPPMTSKQKKASDKRVKDAVDCVTKGVNCIDLDFGPRSSKGSTSTPSWWSTFGSDLFKQVSEDEKNEFWVRPSVKLYPQSDELAWKTGWGLVRVVNRKTGDYTESLIEVKCRFYGEVAVSNIGGNKYLKDSVDEKDLLSIASKICSTSTGVGMIYNYDLGYALTGEYLLTKYGEKRIYFADIETSKYEGKDIPGIFGVQIIRVDYTKKLGQDQDKSKYVFDCLGKKFRGGSLGDIHIKINNGRLSTLDSLEVTPDSLAGMICKKAESLRI